MFLGKAIRLNSVGEPTQKCNRENREWRWHQIKPIYMWSLDLVFKRLRQTNCLNPWGTNIATS